MTVTIAGADGCKAGWVVVRERPDGSATWEVVPTIRQLFDSAAAPDLLTLDIPIGLPASGSRECDVRARRLLGPGRGSSVFPAPIRPVLAASAHAEASEARRKVEGKRISIQAWAIVPKIREFDEFLRGDHIARTHVREVHPEVCFYYMAGGRPMQARKKVKAGHEERAALLRKHFGEAVDLAMMDRRRLGCEVDDLLDAFAALWTARRIRAGSAICLPEHPPCDEFGLPMEMLA